MARGTRLRQVNLQLAPQGLVVGLGQAAAALHPAGQVGQLHPQHGGLDRIKAAVVTQRRVQVPARHAVHRQLANAGGQLGVVAGDGAAIAGATEVFGGEEAEAAHITPAAHGAAGPTGAGGLGAVLHHLEAMGRGDRADPLHVHRPAKQVHGQQGFGGGRDRRLELVEIDQVGALLHIHKHRRGTHGADRFGRGKEAEGAGDHLIPRADAQAAQGQDQGIGAAVAADRELRANAGGELAFKGSDHAAADVLAAAQDLEHGLVQLLTEVLELLGEAERGHLHEDNLKPPIPAIPLSHST